MSPAPDADAPPPRLDDLSPQALDALPFAVVQVDDAGRVTLYSAGAAAFPGWRRDDVLGRDFFRAVAPGAHLPRFHGRFLEGVRRGALDERFMFVFGLDTGPVRVDVRLSKAVAPGRWWITLAPLAELQPTRQRRAALAQGAVARRARAEPVDPSVCEREPIHLPGAVQPHAVMLACDPDELRILACSDNVEEVLGASPAEALGRRLSEFALDGLADQLADGAASGALADPMRPFRTHLQLTPAQAPYLALAHIHDGRLVVELERTPERPEDFEAATPLQAQAAVVRLRQAVRFDEVVQAAAEDLRAMTGFERVLVYRFDPDWNGEAVAESRAEGTRLPPLLGLRFPASDIPAQARALYTRAPARFVVDRDAAPAPVMARPQSSNAPVDLSYAHSRALSPVHLEYQRNLGVNGSMSVAIVVAGGLWGLVIGHHPHPHYVTPETRALTGLVTDALAMRLHELESVEAWREQQESGHVQNTLLQQLAASDDFVSALAGGEGAALLGDLFHVSGAAVVSGARVAATGRAPAPEAVASLAEWLRSTLGPDRRTFHTDALSEHYGPAQAFQREASGLLAVAIDERRDDLLLWFRPEQAATVVWGGDPSKPVLADAATRTVLPRRSFERWVEEVRGRARPWSPWQVDAALSLAAGIEGVVLRQGRKIRELTEQGAALARALEQKDLLAREVDHRVKNSLQIVAGIMLMQARGTADPQARSAFEETYARVMSVARVHDSLQQSDDAERVDLGATVRQLCADLAAGVTGAERRLEVSTEPDLMVPSRTAVAFSLIATELVTNALKYAYEPGEPGEVHVHVTGRDHALELAVCDSGRGLPEDWADKARAASPAGTGGGLGMRVIHAMLAPLDAELKVEPTDPGVCFRVSAPAALAGAVDAPA